MAGALARNDDTSPRTGSRHFSCSSLGSCSCPSRSFRGAISTKYVGHYSLRYFSLLYFALFASIVLVLLANDALSFLVAWEFVSIVSYLLVNFDMSAKRVRKLGFVMLAMSEAGTIAVAIAFLLVGAVARKPGIRRTAVGCARSQRLRWPGPCSCCRSSVLQ